jgi:PAS domain S-box-containing protein
MTNSEVKQLEGQLRELAGELRRAEKQATYWKNLYNEGQKHWDANSASRDQLDSLLDHLPVGLWAINSEGQILQFQGAGWNKLGLGGGEVYGRSIFEVFGENPALSQAVNRALAGEEFWQSIPLDRHLLNCRFFPQWNAEGDVVGVRGVALVANRPFAPKSDGDPLAPWLSGGRLGEWLKSLPGFMLSVLSDGTIRFINRTIPPLTVEDIVGSNICDYVAENRRKEIQEFMDRAFATGEDIDFEIASDDPDGVNRIYDCRLGPFKHEGDIVSAMIIARDVTELRKAEELARKRQNELEHLSRVTTMGEMAAIVAHYLNNPLAAIANYAHGCIRRMRAGDVDLVKLMDAQTEIVEQCTRSSDYIRQLRGFLQKREIHHIETDLTDILIDAIRLTDPEFRSSDLTIHTEILVKQPRVYGDPLQIEQVLVNLLLNAVDAMKPLPGQDADAPEEAAKGPRQIKVRVEETPTGDIAVSVVDYGRGLSPGFEERVFEPFFTTKQRRLGMGLSVSRSIVESHGGRLEVLTHAGSGTTFRFNLPRFKGGESRD